MILRPCVAAVFAALSCSASARPNAVPLEGVAEVDSKGRNYLQAVLNNIGPHGSEAKGVYPGIIIASPSTENPDYFYTWTRDASLTMKMLVDEFQHGNTALRPYIQDFLKSQAILQTVTNPSGALSSGRGLGEPKFHANITRFNGSWGRPQRDGPALRATALITYANWLLNTRNSKDTKEAKDQVWPVVLNDLNYVAQYWNQTGFDLWEEVSGSSFFTIAVQHRALVEGAAFAKRLGKKCANCESQAPNLLCFLQTFWKGDYVVANINTQAARTGLDANTVIGSIATFDPNAPCSDVLFQPCSDRMLSNIIKYVDSFRSIYTVNAKVPKTAPVATGRYAEDVYYDGNPWYLTTLAVAEQLYLAVQQWSTVKSITITQTSLPFWKTVYPGAKIGKYSHSSREYNKLLDGVLDWADGFVSVVHKYTPKSSSMSEQFSRENGTAVSARDLTWSYAAYITTAAARRSATSNYPQVASWGAPSPKSLPSTCVASSAKGTYAPAVAAGAPPGSGVCHVLMTFNVNATTYYGENIYLSGNTTDLGNWGPSDALAGSAIGYTAERPLWTFEVELPANATVEYRYLRKQDDGEWLFETRNRTVQIPSCTDTVPGDGTVVEDAWVGPTGTPSATA